ncbi:MAG: hypothetical protein R2733_07005 [Acidimicrobiales bacterium]
MNTASQDPLSQLEPHDIASAWTSRGLDQMTDAELLHAACEQLSVPRDGEASSFTLHAPLELMARAQLLPMVSRPRRESARQRIAHVAATWATTGASTATIADISPIERPLDALADALRHGDPATADHAFVALCARRDQDQIVDNLVDIVLPQLGGAAHGAILLELLPRFRPARMNPALMARTLVGDIARHPDWQLRWFNQQRPAASEVSLTDRLVSPKADREPSSHFVQPTMALVDDTGLAHRLLADVTQDLPIDEARRQLLTLAAMSMLQDEPASAPYGWTHCLTLPQAALAIAHRAADSRRAIDIAATYVLGFRATQSTGPIDPSWEPDPPHRSSEVVVTHLDPSTAAAAAWHATSEQEVSITQELIDNAAPHHDAHLAKYTLACLDARANDPANGRLFLAAATYLAAWWHQHDHDHPNGALP